MLFLLLIAAQHQFSGRILIFQPSGPPESPSRDMKSTQVQVTNHTQILACLKFSLENFNHVTIPVWSAFEKPFLA